MRFDNVCIVVVTYDTYTIICWNGAIDVDYPVARPRKGVLSFAFETANELALIQSNFGRWSTIIWTKRRPRKRNSYLQRRFQVPFR
jgi:hypothetical protein